MTDHFVEVPKKVLSPGAQAVLDAVRFKVNAECHAPWIAAAAIRAVALQMKFAQDILKLHAIAAELEGHV